MPPGDEVTAEDEVVRVAGYELLRELGQGGMGSVYLARDVALDREVALKVLRLEAMDDGLRARFANEARVVAQAPHPAIVPVLGADLDHVPPYVVLAAMGGGSLEDRIRRGPLPAERVAAMGRRLCGALGHLHERDILHRDLKPANILLDDEGEAYLADFGLAREGLGLGLTATGFLVGTPRYMAPEIFEGGLYSRRTDVYALGHALLEAAVGRKVGKDLVVRAREVAAATQELEHRELRGVLRRMLRSKAADREEDARDLGEAFAAAARGPATAEVPSPATSPQIPPGSARFAAVAEDPEAETVSFLAAFRVALVAGLLAGGAIGWVTRSPATAVADASGAGGPRAPRPVPVEDPAGRFQPLVFERRWTSRGDLLLLGRDRRDGTRLRVAWEVPVPEGHRAEVLPVTRWERGWFAQARILDGARERQRVLAAWGLEGMPYCEARLTHPWIGAGPYRLEGIEGVELLLRQGETLTWVDCDARAASRFRSVPATIPVARDGEGTELILAGGEVAELD